MTKKIIHIIFLVILPAFTGWAQPEKPVMLAEPFSIQVVVPKDSIPPFSGKEWGPFTVLNATEKGLTSANLSRYEVRLVAYDTGSFSIPYAEEENGKSLTQVRVMAPLEEDIKDYTALRELAEVPDKTPFWKWLLFFGGLAVVAIALWHLYKIRKRPPPVEEEMAEEVMKSILQLKEGWANQTLNSVELGDGLIGSLRTCYRVNTKRSSRQLWMAIQKDSGEMTDAQFEATLHNCDAWRFGKRIASLEDGLGAIHAIEKMISKIPQKKLTTQKP